MHINLHTVLIISTFLLLSGKLAFTQDTTSVSIDTTGFDTTRPDTTRLDSTVLTPAQILAGDTVQEKPSSGGIDAEVHYSAADSVVMSIDGKKIFLYKTAEVSYLNIKLQADYIEFDMTNNTVFAEGMPDSSGTIVGRPVFEDGDQKMDAHRLRYNFNSKKGYIEVVRTEQEGGYLHAEKTKKDQFGNINLKNGKYTTCDKENPDYYIALTKAKSIPGDKIVSGPAYLVIEDIPIPIGLPFGFFPNKRESTSGVLIPSYGEEARRGFYLQDGGYYWAINDFADLRLTGSIYTNGTWGIRAGSSYRWRYHFNGNADLRYFKNINGEKGLEGYSRNVDYSINWSHSQDPKANPNRQFRASVNLSTQRFDQNHSYSLQNALTNQKQSSISFQKRWPNSPFNLTASANHSQNSQTGNVNLNLPNMTVTMNTINPFDLKNSSGKKKWYQQIQLKYTATLNNKIQTTDTALFTRHVFDNMTNGFRHEIPLIWNYKPKKLRIITISPNLSYSGVGYTSHIEKHREVITDGDTTFYKTVTDTIEGLSYAHAIYPSIGISLAPKIYGMYQFTNPNSKIIAIRHVMSPTISFNYIPDLSNILPDYYRDIRDESGKVIETYSIYQNYLYGTPTQRNRVRTMSFSLRNNVEAKMRVETDSTTETQKVSILDNFNFSTNMNFDDSIMFQPVSITGNTKLLKGKLNINFRGSADPYAIDSDGRRINKLEYEKSGKIARLTNMGFSMGMRFQGGSEKKSTEATATQGEEVMPASLTPAGGEVGNLNQDYGDYVDFSIPWSVTTNYDFNYSKNRGSVNVVQTLRLNGDLSLTPKWKIGISTGYDLKNSKVTTSNMSIYRDLHCWEMRLTAIPFGRYKSFNFTINVKSTLLRDLKYDKRIPWQDNF